ncbi:MAG: alpha/beta fold hydrolase [Byssovorax sp.]
MSTNDRKTGADGSPDSSPPSSRSPESLSNLPSGPLSRRSQNLYQGRPPNRPSVLPPAPNRPSIPPPANLPSGAVGGWTPNPPTTRQASPPPSTRASILPPATPNPNPPTPASNRTVAPNSSPPSSLSSLNKAIMALDKVKAKLAAVERQKSEPIAIIGMACRFPGGGSSPEAFFELLEQGTDAVTEVPAVRWRIETSEDAAADPERRAVRWGGFLREPVDGLDASFFGISPREARHLDPQQRLLLEVSWEALERAGQDPTRLVASLTGVFVGMTTTDYADLCRAAGPSGEDAYALTGNGHCFAPGRLSYTFGFQGPCIAVDTACSSSLVSVHLACQSLRNGEATMALAGGVNLMLSEGSTRLVATSQGLSPDGRCKTFDAAANGFVRSEGCGMIVLKLLSDAQRDGDTILGLIRGSAVNQDGRSTGMTAPNVLSQQAMLTQALASARVAAGEIGYVETHGTGTSLGDPIEFEALKTVLGKPRVDATSCVLGAVKTNIGHLEAAAGIAGLIKAVMVLQEEVIPKNLHFRALNPRISVDGTPFVIPASNVPWRRGPRIRFAGVSSFGMSGTNAHIILEEAPLEEAATSSVLEASCHIVPMSAKSPEALRALAERYAGLLGSADGARLLDVASAASTRRTHHEHRLTATGKTREDVAEMLSAFARGESPSGVASVRGALRGRPRKVYVFSGQGSQWVGMGQRLLESEPVFRAKLEQCDALLRQRVSWSLLDELRAPEERSRLAQTVIVQPALFAIQVGLAKLLKSWGIRPDAVIGHSVGEVAAAHVAGALSLDQAVRLVTWRGRIMQQATGQGKMAWVALPLEEAARAIAGREAVLAIAAVNDPGSVVISGDTAALEEVVTTLSNRGIECKPLKVDYAFHSPQMDRLAREFMQAVKRVEPARTTIPFYSTVTGGVLDGEVLDLAYWAKNLREPVQFARAMESASGDGYPLFLEIGPHPVLSTNMAQCLAAQKDDGQVLFTMRRKVEDRVALLQSVGNLYVRGVDVDWKALQPSRSHRVTLPTYPWQRQPYWVDVNPEQHRVVAAQPPPEWFYRVDWPEVPRAPTSSPRPGSSAWLVLADRGGVGMALTAELSARGLSYTVLYAPADVSTIAEHVAMLAAGREALKGVIYLWGLDAIIDPDATAGEVGEVTRRCTAPVLALVQALSAAARPPQLWIVTRGACLVSEEPEVAPCQVALWGLGRVAALEHPAAWGGLIDLDPRGGSTEIESLLAEIAAPGTEDQLAFRGGQRRAARLIPASPLESAAPVSLSPQASYLVTGGLGSLGLVMARWLVERGARHVVLTSRHGLPDRASWGVEQPAEVRARIAAIEVLERLGAQITVAAVDVASADEMAALVSALEPPLRGVVHAAGVAPLRTLVETDEALMESVLRSKVAGSWVLHRLLQDRPLDLFVLFSSGSAVWGGHGQGAYAAANAFLDGLAYQRRSQSLPALSVAWGMWAEGGMGDSDAHARLSAIGVLPMSTPAALSALDRLIQARAVQCTVTRMDWTLFAPVYAARGRRNLLTALVAEEAGSEPAPSSAASRSWRGLSSAEARKALESLVTKAVAEVLGFTISAELDAGRGFHEQGLDSLMSVQLRTRLQRELGVTLSVTVAFDHPTVERLVAYLLTDVLEIEDRVEANHAQSAPTDEPIAIVGAACRLPGGAVDLETYWSVLAERRVVTTEVPANRWRAADWFDPNPESPSRTYVTRGGFLADIETFDPAFFRISPREAVSLDPQQRLLLEVSWEALEHAGQAPTALRESRTGVFVGAGPNEYAERLEGLADETAGLYAGTGNMLSVTAGRLSFFLGLHGPSLAVDTACSSALVALHLGCQSLRAGECERALVGGVNVLLSPGGFVMLSRMRALAPDGQCKTFSDAADGYARAEGCAMVVLKRLRDAQRDGDRILAVIRGTAVNHDGASSGLTVPNGPAQQAVLRQALTQAGVAPAEVDFVECHGTGTALGDPIEVQALSAVYGQGRAADHPLVLGSAKANLGHLEPAAGMAGLVKVLLALAHEQIPAQPEMGELNRLLPWDTLPVTVPRAMRSWPRGTRLRRAGVSAFGMSGTNAHVVLEEAPSTSVAVAASERSAELFVLSASSAAAMDAQAARLRVYLDRHAELPLGDIAFSLATTRSPMAHRVAVVATSRDGLQTALQAIADGQTPSGAARGTTASSRGKLAFLFTGQGAQALGMGRALCAEWPAFREAFDRCAALFDRELTLPLRKVMWAEPGSALATQLDQTMFTQPALFTLEYALALLWRSWGVEPDLVVGHSIGELVAACFAGVFSLEDAARLVAARGRLMQALPAGGAMMSIAAPEADVALAVAPYAASVSLAAINGLESVVIAGAETLVLTLGVSFAARGIRTKRLSVSHAFHSPLMDAMLEDFGRIAATVTYRAPNRPVISNVIGAVAGSEIATPEYWVRHVRSAVRFADGIEALHTAGVRTFLEIGPKPTLLGFVSASPRSVGAALVPSLRSERAEPEAVLTALAGWYASGGAVEWTRAFAATARRVELPTYPWQRERHWIDAVPRSSAPKGNTGHWPLAGVAMRMPGAVLHHVLAVGARHQSFLRDHVVFHKVVVPGAFHIAVILAIATERWPNRAIELTGVEFLRAIALDPGQELDLHAVLTPDADGDGYTFELATCAAPEIESRWTTHARGLVRSTDAVAGALPELSELEARASQPIDDTVLFERLSAMQIDWGPLWRWLRHGRGGAGVSLSTLTPTYSSAHQAAPLHPGLLDNGFATTLLGHLSESADSTPWLPFAVERLRWWRVPRGSVTCGTLTRSLGIGTTDLVLVDEDGGVVAEVEGFVSRRAPREMFLRDESAASIGGLYQLQWPQGPTLDTPARGAQLGGTWVIVAAPGSEMASALAGRLERCVVTDPDGLEAALTQDHPLAGVVCLWEPRLGEDAPATAQRVAIEALSVVQTLRGKAPTRLWWVTSGAVAVEPNDAVEVAASTVWGLGRTVIQEQPELGCTLVDLAAGEEALGALVRELSASEGENQIAWRGGRRHVARLTRVTVTATEPRAGVPTQGTVLLTGGLGALGLQLARWLAQQGVKHLILTGRRGLDTPGAAGAVTELEALGARVTVAAVDVANRDALAAVLSSVPHDLPLRGVIHAAGVLDDGMLTEQDAARFERVLSPKATGAWNLHELTSGLDLGFFVMFSSFSGLLGAAGQGNYAAANTFLDALAAHRRARGLPGQSLAWGPWAQGGMAAGLGAAQQARLARQGIAALSPAQGLALFGQAMTSAVAQLGLVLLDLQAVGAAMGGSVPPVWRALVRASSAHGSVAEVRGALAARVAALPAPRRADAVRTAVRADVARVLSLPSAGAVPIDRPLAELGLDSLTAVELRNTLGQRVGATLPATLAFDHPTVEALTRWLLTVIVSPDKPGSALPGSSTAAPPEESTATVESGWHTSLSPFEATRRLVGGRAARVCLREGRAGLRSPALLLLHGVGANHHYFAPLAERLGEYTLIVPSLPGRCGSDGPPVCTVPEAAEWVRDLLTELNPPEVVAIGHSYGGAILMELARMQAARPGERGRLRALIVIATPRVPLEPGLTDMFKSDVETTPADRPMFFLRATSASGAPDALLRLVAPALALTPMAASASDLAAVTDPGYVDPTRGIELPTLVLGGSDDPLAPPPHLRHLSQQIASSRLILLDRVGHNAPLEAADEVASHLISFLDELDLPLALPASTHPGFHAREIKFSPE